jgi:hypothetical protein
MLGCAILPGNVQDRDGCLGVLTAVRRLFPFLERVIADGAYQGQETARAVRRAARARLEIVKRSDAAKGFVVLPKRWIVLPRTILPDSASSGRRWSLASLCPGPSGTRAPWPS